MAIVASHDNAVIKSRPTLVVPLAFALFLAFGIGPNFLLVLLACVVLVLGVRILWRPGEAQVLLFVFVYQWLQVASTLFHANIKNVPVSELYFGYQAMDQASLLIILALLSLAIGMRLGAGPQNPFHLARARSAIMTVPPSRWLRLHLVMWAVSTVSLLLASVIPGLSQGFLALANFKWATFLILTIVTFVRPDASRIAWLFVFGLEFISSFGGFFSSFKLVFIFTLVAITATGLRVTLKQAVAGTVTAAVALVLGIYWTAIKPDYRSFVSGGEAAQVVQVGQLEAISNIIYLAGNVRSGELSRAAEDLARRFSELDMFSAVLVQVPAVVPHQGGTLWWDAVTRPFMPRILFPNKAVIDESALTGRYTGMRVPGFERGTQISMGYIAESYIDFSEFGMWGVLLLFGLFLGRIYRWCVEHPNGHGILGFGLATSIILQLQSIGFSSAKLAGGIMVSVLVAALILGIIVPRFLPWLRT